MQGQKELTQQVMALARLAPSGCFIGLHFRFAAPHILVRTYDPAWLARYDACDYILCDPLISWACAHKGATRWSALGFPDPHGILEQAAEFGLRFGVVVSCGESGSRTVGGFARSDREFTDAEIDDIVGRLNELHEKAAPPVSLTPAQRHALRLVAEGHRYAETADRLGISQSALKARLKAARERLHARTIAEAIQRAQVSKLF